MAVFIVTGPPDGSRSVWRAKAGYQLIPKPFELRHLLGRIAHLVEA